MSVLLEFTIGDEAFSFGRVFSGVPGDLRFELERIVPTGETMMPYVWVTGDDLDAFEKKVRANPVVRAIRELDRIDESRLYRIEWADVTADLILGIANAEAVILEARGDDIWSFRLRFDDHTKLSQFHNFVIEQSIPIHIERTYTLTDEAESRYLFDLSFKQREALLLALHRGYFETPSEAKLADLTEELDISRQALSHRLRRGNLKILRKVLLSSAPERE